MNETPSNTAFSKSVTENSNTISAIVHASSFLGLFPIPFLNLLLSGSIWKLMGRFHKNIKENGKEAFCFQSLLYVPYFLTQQIYGSSSITSWGSGTFLAKAFMITLLIWSAIAARKAYLEGVYRYPFSILRLPWNQYLSKMNNVIMSGRLTNREKEKDFKNEHIRSKNSKETSAMTRRYPALQAISIIFRFLACVAFAISMYLILIAILSSEYEDVLGYPTKGLSFIASIVAFIIGLVFLVSGEMIKVFLAIEENTRATANELIKRDMPAYAPAAIKSPEASFAGTEERNVKCMNCGEIYTDLRKGQYCEHCGGKIG